jgi:hypothetical protein
MAVSPATPNPNEGYEVVTPSEAEQKRLLTSIISPRRGPSASVPGLKLLEGCLMADEMYTKFGMDELVGCVTGEMISRPVPQVFRTSSVKALTDLYTEWLPDIGMWVLPQVQAPFQTYNKISRVGWPGFYRPENKLSYVLQFMREILEGDLARFEEAFIVMGIRVQAESKTKEREFIFVNDNDKIVAKKVSGKQRTIKTPAGPRIGSRTRLVFNLPIYNLVKQVFDTAIHNVFMRHPAFHHDMNNGNILPVRGFHLCFDVSQFERNTAECNRVRAQFYGGVYARCSDITSRIPFAVPTDTWDGARMLYVNREAGWSDQYASGDSAVAPSQKEIFMAIYANFAHRELGIPRSAACAWVAGGGDARLTIRNYGDDNSINGEEKVVWAFFEYVKQYLPVSVEDPPRFLGFQWFPEYQQWLLPITSYLTKVYNNERAPGSNFREFPFLGWTEKRKVYSRIGDPRISREVFGIEDKLLDRVGLPWYQIERLASEDRVKAAKKGKLAALHPAMLLGKEYSMTPAEQIAAGTHTGLNSDATRSILPKLVSKETNKYIKL